MGIVAGLFIFLVLFWNLAGTLRGAGESVGGGFGGGWRSWVMPMVVVFGVAFVGLYALAKMKES